MSPAQKAILYGTILGILGFYLVYVMMDNHKCQKLYDEGALSAFNAKGCWVETTARSPASRLWISSIRLFGP